MNYSLLSRFRGAWLGSLIGQQLANHNRLITIREQKTSISELAKPKSFWRSRQSRGAARSTPEILSALQEQFNVLETLRWESIDSVSGQEYYLLAIFPVIMYYHDDWCSLSSFINQNRYSLQQSQKEIDNILVWCYTVRLALRGELVCCGLTERVVVGIGLKQTASIQWLKEVEMSCLNGLNSIQLAKKLSAMENGDLALSLFCVLQNPEDFFLTIQQALFWEKQTTMITALSGVLSGAYNGLTGIPVNWRNLSQNQDFYQQITTKTENMIAEWLGIELTVNRGTLSSVITSPRVLQPRSNLKIISQQEY
ncbi:conserved hypothetical protein [Hyella patelloides LEGE 07179]|uniref:ADP-ribosylglycohydrolase family protein n=1 Tax=Hyella patelloides LEGE 07179 TaxID=945734 RepID=A0A563VT70_9CYAN|nr:hypothetical protein [Hyella patelloides]VEP14666.1 conserved hypothetical protein [Hyella patelloides LEGE 07179]